MRTVPVPQTTRFIIAQTQAHVVLSSKTSVRMLYIVISVSLIVIHFVYDVLRHVSNAAVACYP